MILALIVFLVVVSVWLVLPALYPSAPIFSEKKDVQTIESTIAAADGGAWISIFDGNQIDAFSTDEGGRATSETVTGGVPTVRISSPDDAAGIEVGLVVGAGVTSELARKTARAELTVGSPDGKPRTFSVRCLFDGESRCGRQRFSTSIAREPFVFDIDLKDIADGAGRIAIDPAFGQNARDLTIFGLRLRPAN